MTPEEIAELKGAPKIPKRRVRAVVRNEGDDSSGENEPLHSEKKAKSDDKPKKILDMSKPESEIKSAIRPFMLAGELGTMATDRLLTSFLEVDGLTKDEKDRLSMAVAAVAYENIEVLSANYLLLLTLASIAIPRMPQLAKKKKEENMKEMTDKKLALVPQNLGNGN